MLVVNPKYLLRLDKNGNPLGMQSDYRYYECEHCKTKFETPELLTIDHEKHDHDVEKLLRDALISHGSFEDDICDFVCERDISCPHCKDYIKVRVRIEECSFTLDNSGNFGDIVNYYSACIADPWDIEGLHLPQKHYLYDVPTSAERNNYKDMKKLE